MAQNSLLTMNESHSQSTDRAFINMTQQQNGRLANLEHPPADANTYSHEGVVFNKRCRDCHGTGRRWRKIGLLGLVLPKVPCNKCYKASGVCLKCKGHGLDEKDRHCKHCFATFS